MIELSKGNLLTADVDALVNTVNTQGVMGKGIALQFKQAYPEVFKHYVQACAAGQVRLGCMHVVDLGGLVGGPRYVINFPTKGHWKSKSRIADIESGLADLVKVVQRLNIKSVAIPPLGCGNGGLDWLAVRPLIEAAVATIPDVTAKVFLPAGAPEAAAMPIRTERPCLTIARAALIALVRRYQCALLDPIVSLLEVHKLMYFLQEAGEPELRLRYTAHTYGPYAQNLRQVMIKLEGHYLRGYGDGADTPSKTIELVDRAADEADAFLAAHREVRSRIDRVAQLIEGFEDPYGMELLSSMHWVMTHQPGTATSAELAIERVRAWNPGKQRRLKPQHLQTAWNQLKRLKWDTEALSAQH
jgi:O-acetyl-ADP-ribose deacetylase (regulator of RNase III)